MIFTNFMFRKTFKPILKNPDDKMSEHKNYPMHTKPFTFSIFRNPDYIKKITYLKETQMIRAHKKNPRPTKPFTFPNFRNPK